MEALVSKIVPSARHQHHLSGKSSQALGLGLLGSACYRQPFLEWFESALSPIAPFSLLRQPSVEFEHALEPSVLNEHPWVTTIDLLVETDDAVICTEIKWAEDGLGRCSCGAAESMVADCASRVLVR
jgi:hypothetical protein